MSTYTERDARDWQRELAAKDKTIKELAGTLSDLAEFWKHGTPVYPGSDLTNEAMAQIKALRAEGKIP